MEKLRLEVSTHSLYLSALTRGCCAVCGLILSTQAPLFAAESSAQLLHAATIRPATIRPATIRPAKPKSGQATAANSVAKTQISKARTSPIKTLQPTAASKAMRSALTEPPAGTQAQAEDSLATILPAAEETQREPQPKTIAAPDARIVMTALPVVEVAANETVKADETATINEAVTVMETADVETDAVEANSESEPLTGTIILDGNTQPASPETTAPETTTSTPSATPVTADAKLTQTSRLFAPSISYENGAIIAEGTEEEPVRLEGINTRIVARKVRLDTVNQTVRAEGQVRVERQITRARFLTFSPDQSGGDEKNQTITETLQGENFEYNYGTREGKLDATRVRLASFNISAEEIIINGTKYIARNVIIRPGGLSDEQIKIYGTPPFSIHAAKVTVDTGASAPERTGASDTTDDLRVSGPTAARTQVQGAALYFKNFRLFPIPSALLGRSFAGPREQETYQLTPRVAFNSADGLLVTVGLEFPFSSEKPGLLALKTDIGVSTRVGFRGGATLSSKNKLGRFSLGARLNDVISSQLTNRIELDRLPEFSYRPPRLPLFELPGGRRAGLVFDFSAGNYRERFTTGERFVSGSRKQAQVRFTTRFAEDTGPYLDLTARRAIYSNNDKNLGTAGFEVGYVGSIGSRLSGQFSFGSTKVSGSTPFEFDEVEIRKELRATFDILLTPRYIIPIDLRYDLDRKELREKTFGLLRNYNTFAYGLTYQASRRELQFQVRQGF